MHIIRYADSVFRLPKKILKISVMPKDATTRPRVDVDYVPRYTDSAFLVLIEYTQKGSLVANGAMPRGYSNTRLWGLIAATCKRETADKLYEALALSVFTSRGSGVCVCLDVRDIMAADVVQQPAPRQGKGRAVDIDGTGITAIAQQLTKAPEVHVTRYGGGTDWGRTSSQAAGGWLGAYGSVGGGGGGGGGAASIPSVASIAGWRPSGVDTEHARPLWMAAPAGVDVNLDVNIAAVPDSTAQTTADAAADSIAAINTERRQLNDAVASLGRPFTRVTIDDMRDAATSE